MTSSTPSIDYILRPYLTRSTGDRAILAALVRGLELGYTTRQIGSAVHRLDPSLSISSPSWYRLVSAARRRILSSTTGGGGAEKIRLRASRRVVGHLLNPSPAGLGPRAEVSARVAFGAAAGIFLREAEARGFDTIILTAAYLASRLGVSQRTAVRALKTLRSIGWLSAAPKAAGGAARYRLGRLSHAEGLVAYRFGGTVDALAAGGTDPLAEVLRSALSPAWHYGLGGRAWLALAAHRAGVGGLGLSPALQKRARAEAEKLLPGVWEGTAPLAPVLDALAATPGVIGRKAAAEETLAASAAAHREQLAGLMVRRAEKNSILTAGRAAIKRAWAQTGSPPPPGQEAALRAWATGARALFEVHPPPAGLREVLASQLAWRGYGAPEVARIVGHVLPPT